MTKPISLKAVLIATCLVVLLSGCAGHRTKGPSDPTTAPAPTPAGVALSTADETTPPAGSDDMSLWEDDLDWDDEGAGDFYTVADPLEPFNRTMFVFNDKLYFWVLKPVAQGYRFAVPRPARSGVRNFFNNLGAPIRIANNILQGRFQTAEAEVARFLYNSTVGVLGFGNPAADVEGLNPEPTDLGLTLGHYGIGNGFYLVWPVLGPSTLRDSAGYFGDRWLNPTIYIDPIEASLAVFALRSINTVSFHIGDYEAIKSAALDPYQAMRDAYIQLRRSKLR